MNLQRIRTMAFGGLSMHGNLWILGDDTLFARSRYE